MAAVERTIDDLALTEAGELARREAQETVAAMLAGAPNVRPLPLDPPRHPAHVVRHSVFMARAFDRGFPRRHSYKLSALRGTAPAYLDTEEMAWRLGGESVEVPDACLPVLPEPEIGADGMIWGGSVTCRPRQPDPTCPMWGDALPEHDRPEVPHVSLEERWALTDVGAAVGEWLETLYEPLSARELADATGYPLGDVARALSALHSNGKVACQLWRESHSGAPVEASWVWRRLR